MPRPILIDLRDLSATDKAFVGLMVDRLLAEKAARDIDLGDEREIIRVLVGWYPPDLILRFIDHIAEQARAAKQERATIGDLIGAAALFVFMLAGAVLTLIPTEAYAATGAIADDWGLWPGVAVLVLGALGVIWSLRPYRDERDEEESETDRRYRSFEQ